MMERKDLLYVSIITFITVFAWIIFDVYHSAVTSTLTDVQQKLVSVLNPKIEESTLEKIRERQL